MTRVLVTGGTGFVGKRTVPRLISEGFTPCLLIRSDRAAALANDMGADVVHGDLDDPTSLNSAFLASGADALLNIASLGFGHGPSIVDACVAAGIRRVVFVSTTAIFTSLNASTKAVRQHAETYIRESGLDYTIIRPTMIYGGPDDRNLSRLVRLVRRTPVVPLPGGGMHLQQPIHVADVAESLVRALLRPATSGREYDIAGPTAVTFRSIVKETGAACGRRTATFRLPITPFIAAARALERVTSQPWIKAEQFQRLVENKSFDIAVAVRDLDFHPRSFAVGIRETIAEMDSDGGPA